MWLLQVHLPQSISWKQLETWQHRIMVLNLRFEKIKGYCQFHDIASYGAFRHIFTVAFLLFLDPTAAKMPLLRIKIYIWTKNKQKLDGFRIRIANPIKYFSNWYMFLLSCSFLSRKMRMSDFKNFITTDITLGTILIDKSITRKKKNLKP